MESRYIKTILNYNNEEIIIDKRYIIPPKRGYIYEEDERVEKIIRKKIYWIVGKIRKLKLKNKKKRKKSVIIFGRKEKSCTFALPIRNNATRLEQTGK